MDHKCLPKLYWSCCQLLSYLMSRCSFEKDTCCIRTCFLVLGGVILAHRVMMKAVGNPAQIFELYTKPEKVAPTQSQYDIYMHSKAEKSHIELISFEKDAPTRQLRLHIHIWVRVGFVHQLQNLQLMLAGLRTCLYTRVCQVMHSDLIEELKDDLATWTKQHMAMYEGAVNCISSEPHESCWCLLKTALQSWIEACMRDDIPEREQRQTTWGAIVLIIFQMVAKGHHYGRPYTRAKQQALKNSLILSFSQIKQHSLVPQTNIIGLKLSVGTTILRNVGLKIRPLWLRTFWRTFGESVSRSALGAVEGDRLWHMVLNDLSMSIKKRDKLHERAILQLIPDKVSAFTAFLNRNYDDSKLRLYTLGIDCLCHRLNFSSGLAEFVASRFSFIWSQTESGTRLSVGDWTFFDYLKKSRSPANSLTIEKIVDSSDFTISMLLDISRHSPRKIVRETAIRQLLRICLPHMTRSLCLKVVRMTVMFLSQLKSTKDSWLIDPMAEYLSRGFDLPAKFILPVISTPPGRKALRGLITEPQAFLRLVTIAPEITTILCGQLALEEQNVRILSSQISNLSTFAFVKLRTLAKDVRVADGMTNLLHEIKTCDLYQDLLTDILNSLEDSPSHLDKELGPSVYKILDQCSYQCIDPSAVTNLIKGIKFCSPELRAKVLELILKFVKVRPSLLRDIRCYAHDLTAIREIGAGSVVQILALSPDADFVLRKAPHSNCNYEFVCQELIKGFAVPPQPNPAILEGAIKLLYRWRGIEALTQYFHVTELNSLDRVKIFLVKHTADALIDTIAAQEISFIAPILTGVLPQLESKAVSFDQDALEAMTSATLLLAHHLSIIDCQRLIEIVALTIEGTRAEIATNSLFELMQSGVLCGLLPLQRMIVYLHEILRQRPGTDKKPFSNALAMVCVKSTPMAESSNISSNTVRSDEDITKPYNSRVFKDLRDCLNCAARSGLWLHDFSYLLVLYADMIEADLLVAYYFGLNSDQICGLVVSILRVMLTLEFSLQEMIIPFTRVVESVLKTKDHVIIVANLLLQLQYCTFDRQEQLFYFKRGSRPRDSRASQNQTSDLDPVTMPEFHHACDTLQQCLLLHCEGWIEVEELFSQDSRYKRKFPITLNSAVRPLPIHQQLTKIAASSRRLNQRRATELLSYARSCRGLRLATPKKRKRD